MAECECPAGVPEWLVTFGDMMSLLLTFFIMLVSMSEMKKDEQYQAMVEAIQKQFGHDSAPDSMAPGNQKPRNSNMSAVAVMGRSKRLDLMQGGQPLKAPVGENAKPQAPINGEKTSIRFELLFNSLTAEPIVRDPAKINGVIAEMAGKNQYIEISGHTTKLRLPKDSTYEDHFDLAYARAIVAKKLLIQKGISPDQIILKSFGSSQPRNFSIVPEEQAENDRVEVVMTNQVISLKGQRK